MLSLGSQVLKYDIRMDRNKSSLRVGSPADCLKHSILVSVLMDFVGDARPFVYIDTHSGTGIYDLTSPEAQRFQNHQGGVLSLNQKSLRSRSVREYLRLHTVFGDDAYLGSPAIAQCYLRPQDASLLFEASPKVAKDLEHNLTFGTAQIVRSSCYSWFSKVENLQSISNKCRILALIDPPYDSASSSDKWNLYLVKQIRDTWTDSCVLLWHPFATKEHT